MRCKDMIVVAVAAAMATALSVVPADARSKREKPPRAETTSLDGRITGRPRTCWHDTFIYDNRGFTVGPYCH